MGALKLPVLSFNALGADEACVNSTTDIQAAELMPELGALASSTTARITPGFILLLFSLSPLREFRATGMANRLGAIQGVVFLHVL